MRDLSTKPDSDRLNAEGEQKTSSEYYAPQCKKCQSAEVRRLKRKFSHKLFSTQPYLCSRCKNRQDGFKREWWVIPKVLLLFGIVGLIVYFSINPPTLSRFTGGSASEVESLARARAAMGGQLSSFEQMMSKKPKGTLDNATVLRLWRANVGTNVILQMIRTSNGEYDVSANAIIVLRDAQVDQSVILAMIDANYNAR